MDKPKRIQRKRIKGWRMPPNTVYVGRGSRWGNPYICDDPALAVEAYAAHFDPAQAYCGSMGRPWGDGLLESLRGRGIRINTRAMNNLQGMEEQSDYDMDQILNLEVLRGKNLACWCPLDKPCHADFLLKIANRERRT